MDFYNVTWMCKSSLSLVLGTMKLPSIGRSNSGSSGYSCPFPLGSLGFTVFRVYLVQRSRYGSNFHSVNVIHTFVGCCVLYAWVLYCGRALWEGHLGGVLLPGRVLPTSDCCCGNGSWPTLLVGWSYPGHLAGACFFFFLGWNMAVKSLAYSFSILAVFPFFCLSLRSPAMAIPWASVMASIASSCFSLSYRVNSTFCSIRVTCLLSLSSCSLRPWSVLLCRFSSWAIRSFMLAMVGSLPLIL